MNTALDQLLKKTYESEGNTKDVNNFYLEFFKTPLYVPIDPANSAEDSSAIQPLFCLENELLLMAAFDSLEKLQDWAKEYKDEMHYAQISGEEVIQGVGLKTSLALNPGTSLYKEFSPEELLHLKKMLVKVATLKKAQNHS